jgi:predicted kinase
MAGGGQVLVFFGMIAAGKSYLASAWAARHGCPYYNSDRVRKELAGMNPVERQATGVDQGIYTQEFSRRTYDHLLFLAEQELVQEGERCVVLDGSYQRSAERERVLQRLAVKARVVFVQCVCPEELMRERMEQRQRDPLAVSDGRWEIYLQQRARFEMPLELTPEQLITLTTDQNLETLLDILDGWLRQEDNSSKERSYRV